jgi:hypothetical protein
MTEQDFDASDEDDEGDNLDSGVSLEDFDVLIDTLKDYDEHEEH